MPHYSYQSPRDSNGFRITGIVGRKKLNGKTALAAFNKKTILVNKK